MSLRFLVIATYPHRAGQIKPTTATAEFSSRTLAESHAKKVERQEPGVKVSIVDMLGHVDPMVLAQKEREGFKNNPFEKLLAGVRV